jgi:hypothetical protein
MGIAAGPVADAGREAVIPRFQSRPHPKPAMWRAMAPPSKKPFDSS